MMMVTVTVTAAASASATDSESDVTVQSFFFCFPLLWTPSTAPAAADELLDIGHYTGTSSGRYGSRTTLA